MLVVRKIDGTKIGSLDVVNGESKVDGSAEWLLTVRRGNGVTWKKWSHFQRLMNQWSNGYLIVSRER